MITFDRGDCRFNCRAVAVIIENGRALLHRLESDNYWSLPGGRCELMESTADSVKREMREELSIDVKIERLLWLIENFFTHEGKSYHEFGFYYLVSLPADRPASIDQECFEGVEEGIRLVFKWFDIDNLENVELYPDFLRSALKSIPTCTEHVVHVDPSSA